MFLRRKMLASVVLNLLAKSPPLKAKEIAAALRNTVGFQNAEKSEINSVLYGELRERLEQKEDFRWSLRRDRLSKPAIPISPSRHSTGTPSPRRPSPRPPAALLRTIQRLRCGLPPGENIRQLTVGARESVQAINGLVHGSGPCRWLVVRGNYGQGKTHTIGLFREIAHQARFATCQLSADSAACALNHPQRFLPILLSTLEVPGKTFHGYEHMIWKMLQEPQQAVKLQQVVDSVIPRESKLGQQLYWDLETIRALLQDGTDEYGLEGLATSSMNVALALSGQMQRHSVGGPFYRQRAYQLLRIALLLVVKTGANGLAIAIDEVESVFTKLPTHLSRLGACRVLAALCESDSPHRCPVLLAITPDAYRMLVGDFHRFVTDSDALPEEPVVSWISRLVVGGVRTLQCKNPNNSERIGLLEQIRLMYRRAYPESFREHTDEMEWHSFLSAVQKRNLPVRLLIREAVDLMDGLRWRAREPTRISGA